MTDTTTQDPVPFFTEYGKHSSPVVRSLAYVACRGNEGVMGSTDCVVRATPTPSGNVTVDIGSYAILCRATGQANQMYVGRNLSQASVAIPATDATGPKSYLVIIRVENPYLPGEQWGYPNVPEDGPYVFTRVVGDGVTTATRKVTDLGNSWSAITLARVDVPASTGAITQSMITDLRPDTGFGGASGGVAASPQVSVYSTDKQMTTSEQLTSSSFVTWPTQAQWSVPVPPWATNAEITAAFNGCVCSTANFLGEIYGQFDGQQTNSLYILFYCSGTADTTNHLTLSKTMTIPTSMRGTTQPMSFKARRLSGSGKLSVVNGSVVTLRITFTQQLST